MKQYRVFISSYTRSKPDAPGGKGIYVYNFNSADGSLTPVCVHTDCADPSYLTVRGDMLYAAQEVRDDGGVAALKIMPAGNLEYIGRTHLPAGATCHIAMWPDGSHILASHYGTGALTNIAVNEDGSTGAVINTVYHYGSSKEPRRQAAPHVHSSWVSPDGENLLVCDLGTDIVSVYTIDKNSGFIVRDSKKKAAQTPAGRGPRHLEFAPDGKHFALITEMGGTVIVYPYGDNGIGEPVCEVSILPEGFDTLNTAADIHYSPDGKFLYASNRGHDSIAVFKVDENGMLYDRKFYTCFGSGPRNFCLTPDGEYIIVTNQHSGNAAIAPLCKQTGAIGEKLCEVQIPQAVCALSTIVN